MVLQIDISLNKWRNKAYKNLSEGTLLDYEIQISMLIFKRPCKFYKIQKLRLKLWSFIKLMKNLSIYKRWYTLSKEEKLNMDRSKLKA